MALLTGEFVLGLDHWMHITTWRNMSSKYGVWWRNSKWQVFVKIQPPAALICLTAAVSTTCNGQDENAGILSAGCKPECSEVLYLCWQYQLHASIKIIKKKKKFCLMSKVLNYTKKGSVTSQTGEKLQQVTGCQTDKQGGYIYSWKSGIKGWGNQGMIMHKE